MKLTTDQIKSYEQNGYIIVPALFTKEEISNIAKASEDLAQQALQLPTTTESVI